MRIGSTRCLVIHRRAQAEDAGDGGDEQHIVAADQIARGRQAQAIQIIISAGIFFDVDIALRDVRFGLVVIVIADEISDRVVGKQFLEFLIKLGGERFVVADHQRRPVDAGDGVGHREGLARAGDAHERLEFLPLLDAGDELVDRLRLIALGLERADDFKIGHGKDYSSHISLMNHPIFRRAAFNLCVKKCPIGSRNVPETPRGPRGA